jgi:hypothetical protein
MVAENFYYLSAEASDKHGHPIQVLLCVLTQQNPQGCDGMDIAYVFSR